MIFMLLSIYLSHTNLINYVVYLTEQKHKMSIYAYV